MKPFTCAILLTALAAAVNAAPGEKPVVRKHWFVTGQVQGVGFRAFTADAARELKLRGWVRNLTDARVELVAEGEEKAVVELLARVEKGPRSAKVKSVDEAKVDSTEKLAERFEIRDTADPPKPGV
jgi:acylphosphatase